MKRHLSMIITSIIVLVGCPFIFSLAGAFLFHAPKTSTIVGLLGGILITVIAWRDYFCNRPTKR